MEAGEPEVRAAEEKSVEEKEEERKTEKMGSEANVSRGDAVAVVGVAVEVGVEVLKVERRCSGEALEETGDGEAIFDSLESLSLCRLLLFYYPRPPLLCCNRTCLRWLLAWLSFFFFFSFFFFIVSVGCWVNMLSPNLAQPKSFFIFPLNLLSPSL